MSCPHVSKGPELSSPHSPGARKSGPAPEEATGTQGTQGNPVVGPPGGGRNGCRGAGPGQNPGWGQWGRREASPRSASPGCTLLEGQRASYFCTSRAPEPGEKLAHLSKNDGLSPPFPLPPRELGITGNLLEGLQRKGLLPQHVPEFGVSLCRLDPEGSRARVCDEGLRVRWPRFIDMGPQPRRRLPDLEPHMGRVRQTGAVGGKVLSALGVGPPRGPILPDRCPGSFQTDLRRKDRLLRWGCVCW